MGIARNIKKCLEDEDTWDIVKARAVPDGPPPPPAAGSGTAAGTSEHAVSASEEAETQGAAIGNARNAIPERTFTGARKQATADGVGNGQGTGNRGNRLMNT